MKRFSFFLMCALMAFTVSAQIKFVTELPNAERIIWVRPIASDTTECYLVTEVGIQEGIRITPRYYVVSASEKYAEAFDEKIIYGPYVFRINEANHPQVSPIAWIDKVDVFKVTFGSGHPAWQGSIRLGDGGRIITQD